MFKLYPFRVSTSDSKVSIRAINSLIAISPTPAISLGDNVAFCVSFVPSLLVISPPNPESSVPVPKAL